MKHTQSSSDTTEQTVDVNDTEHLIERRSANCRRDKKQFTNSIASKV
jgi:hypothetical protein